jgi:predicted nicotinamide N-methyase
MLSALLLLWMSSAVPVGASSEVLMIEGKLFPLDFAGGELTIHGQPLLVSEVPNSGQGTGHTVWDGSVVLAKYLEARYATLAGRSVLELGSGPGVAGLAALALGGRVTFSDLPYCLPNLQAVVQRNAHLVKGGAAPSVGVLDWTAPQSSSLAGLQAMDLVLGADVVWVEELIGPLASTLAWLTAGPSPPTILLAHQTRSTRGDDLLYSALAEAGLQVAAAGADTHHPDFSHPRIKILVITRPQEL